jgi:hypothetical protein
MPQDDLPSPGQERDISIEITVTEMSPETSGYLYNNIEVVQEYYSIIQNGRKNHYIISYKKSLLQ